jgi:hypothetical protein
MVSIIDCRWSAIVLLLQTSRSVAYYIDAVNIFELVNAIIRVCPHSSTSYVGTQRKAVATALLNARFLTFDSGAYIIHSAGLIALWC